MIKNYFCFSPGDIFANNKGDEITILDIEFISDLDDANGSFDSNQVHYWWTKGWRTGKKAIREDYSLIEWLNKNKFKEVK